MSLVSGSRRALAVLVLVLAAVVLMPAPQVRAHAELTSSDPADGATVTEVPKTVSLTFGEDLMAEGSGLNAKSIDSGRAVDLTGIDVQGETVSADWPQGTPSGKYQVAFRVVSADGHPVEGTLDFTIALPVGGATVTVGPPASTAPAASSAPASASASPVEDSSDDGSSLLAWIIGFVVVVAVGGTAGMWIMKRANRM